ncbi:MULTISPECIES: DUF6456 domain-containing protein [Agrobacterium]|uniref:DUF6456 domain-containing protein n=1 Tax=Agrobacterium TaxID=357 RepID=UPI00278A1193|nr:DUF6456 domain-containing protein [Agrobacterium sp. SORGH_AS_0745]MDP9760742.1 hypothetical protein [Agrobacterium tumefaciens]MDQ1221969.1 hypothetical protein [Agrobacterium sp. SORGH_AS_0745]
MSETKSAPSILPDPVLLRLLRCIAAGTADISEDRGDMVLQRPEAGNGRTGRPALRFPATTVQLALSSGLIERRENTLSAAPPLASYLKRAIARDRDEIFQEQHWDLQTVVLDVGKDRQPARRNLNSSPLTGLSRLKEKDGTAFFPSDALQAGERLAADFHRAQLNPKVTATWEPKIASRTKGEAGGKLDLTDAAISARTRFSRAADAMGPELSGVAIDICCFEKGLEAVERERQWPARSAKLLLRAALLSLARHYAPQAQRSRRTSHHWGDEDYRPPMAPTMATE